MINGLDIYYEKIIGRGLKPVSTNNRKMAAGLKPVSNKGSGLSPASTKGKACKKVEAGLKILQ